MKQFLTMLRLMTGLTAGGLTSVLVLSTSLGLGLALLIFVQMNPLWALLVLPLVISGPLFFLWALMEFLRFCRWQERLPFSLEGDLFVIQQMNSELWHSASIEIQCPGSNKEQIRMIHDALTWFCARANGAIYESMWGRIINWQLDSPMSAAGDANSQVAWRLYRFLSGPLTGLVNKGAPVQRVLFSISPSGRHVMPESETMSQ